MAIIARVNVQWTLSAIIPITMTLMAAANPAFFVPAARRVAIVVGAPEYVSGNHM